MSILSKDKMGQNQSQLFPSNSKNVVVVIYLLEVITKVGRYFPIIVLSLASLNIFMATNDFLANSFEFGILNSLFAASGVFSLIQMRQRNKISLVDPPHTDSDFQNIQKIRR